MEKNAPKIMTTTHYKEYRVWDLATRCFHWFNVLFVILLAALGLIMMYRSELGLVGTPVKIALKTLHVWIGYLFATNLLIRIIWGFVGSHHNRWKTLLSFEKGYWKTLTNYVKGTQPKKQFIGHNPMGRLAVIALYLLLTIMTVTGLVRASTDIYYPPFGKAVTSYIAKTNVSSNKIKPYDEAYVDKEKFQRLKTFKHPFGVIHVYTFYALMLLVLLHISAVILTEIREGGSLISAMFTGKKLLKEND